MATTSLRSLLDGLLCAHAALRMRRLLALPQLHGFVLLRTRLHVPGVHQKKRRLPASVRTACKGHRKTIGHGALWQQSGAP